MSQTESRIRLVFEGVERGVVAAAGKASAAIKSLEKDNSKLEKASDKAGSALLGIGKGMAVLGAANGAIQVVGGVAGALTQLAPAALLLPGALLAGGAAMGTFKIATAGMGKALEAGLSGNLEKFAKDTKNMAPAMQDAAKAVVGLKPQIDDLKHTVQGNFWGGFSDGIKSAGATYLPILKTGLGDIATSLGKVGLNALKATQSPIFTSSVAGILDRTSTTLGNMSGAAGDVLTGFVRLGAAGATYLPKLGTGIGDVAKRFADWSVKVVQSGKFFDWVDGAISGFKDLGATAKNIGSIIGTVFTGLGGVVESPLARIRELTGQVAEFLKTASAQEGLKALGSALQTIGEVVGRVVMTALRELMPTLVKLAPIAQEVARTLGDLLVGALETLGPIIRGIADVFNAFPGSAGAATVAVVGFVAAIKTIKAVNAVTDLLGIDNMFTRIGKSAGGAEAAAATAGAKSGTSWGKAFVGAVGVIGAVVGGTILVDKLIPKDLGGRGSQAARDMLGEIAAVFSGEGEKAFQSFDVARWITNPFAAAGEVASRELAKLFGFAPPPIPVHIDTQPATKEFNGWNDHVGDSIATANLDADPSRAMGVVHDWEGGVSRTRGTASLDADASRGNNVLGGWKGSANATVGTAHLGAEPGQANSATSGWQGRANSTVGVAHLNATPSGADQQLGGWRGRANATVGTAQLRASTSAAEAAANAFVARWQGRMIYVNFGGSRVTGATGGAVTDGRIIPRLAGGGPIRGPGTGTSDTAGLFALANGEYVASARQVANAGGPDAFGGLMAALDQGPMRASAQAAMRTPVPASSLSGGGVVTLKVAPGGDGALATLIMRMIRENKIQLKAA